MSRTYALACVQCKKYLWIGQGHGYDKIEALRIYFTPESKQKLEYFLSDHYRHPLVFDDECEHLPDEYENIEGDD